MNDSRMTRMTRAQYTAARREHRAAVFVCRLVGHTGPLVEMGWRLFREGRNYVFQPLDESAREAAYYWLGRGW